MEELSLKTSSVYMDAKRHSVQRHGMPQNFVVLASAKSPTAGESPELGPFVPKVRYSRPTIIGAAVSASAPACLQGPEGLSLPRRQAKPLGVDVSHGRWGGRRLARYEASRITSNNLQFMNYYFQ